MGPNESLHVGMENEDCRGGDAIQEMMCGWTTTIEFYETLMRNTCCSYFCVFQYFVRQSSSLLNLNTKLRERRQQEKQNSMFLKSIINMSNISNFRTRSKTLVRRNLFFTHL